MARLINDYHCTSCGTVTEHWINREEEATLTCPECGNSTMKRMICAPRLAYTDMACGSGSMPTAIDKWDKMRRQKMIIEKRTMERHGSES